MTCELTIERDVEMPARDGVVLRGDVYRPGDGDRHPTLVHRTPYGKGAVALVNDLVFSPIEAVERGFAVVVQDVRGTGASDGAFAPLTQERADGHDTFAWVEAQPWSDGTYGIYGSSYMGVTTMQAAVDAPAGLKAVFAYITGSTYQNGWMRTGGIVELALKVRWTLVQLAGQLQRPDRAGDADPEVLSLMQRFGADPFKVLHDAIDPAVFVDTLAKVAPFFVDWVERGPDDPYWEGLDVAAAVDRIHAPVMHVAGWYDGFIGEHLALQERLADVYGPDMAHRFVVGPWTHDAYFGVFTASMAGKRNFGAGALGGRAGLATIALDWFEQWLGSGDGDRRGGGTGASAGAGAGAGAPVRYFHIGPNRWETAEAWPPPHRLQRWHLRSGGRANTRSGDGQLTLEAPVGAEPADSYLYDPMAPAPTVGGAHMAYGMVETGVHDQGALEDRADVLVYTSAHLVEPLTLVGPVGVELFVRSSAPTTDFVATLVDVAPDGGATNIVDGALRMEADPAVTVGTVRTVTIDLHAIAYTLPAGHQLRLHVTSSSFPRLERNRNIDLSGSRGSGDGSGSYAVAVQHVLHDPDHPSAVSLPIPEVIA